MDMTRHLKRWLNDSELRRLGDRYEGIIRDVLEEQIRNRFTCVKQPEPVVVFEDGWRVVPNIGMRRALIEFFGRETDDWIGRRVVVYRHRVETKNSDSGTVRSRWEKRAMRPDVEAPPHANHRRTHRGKGTPIQLTSPSSTLEDHKLPHHGMVTAEDIPWQK